MDANNRKGSVLTSVIAAALFFLILAVFGRSIHGENLRIHPRSITTATSQQQTVVGAGFYQTYLHETAKQDFMPQIRDLE